MLLKIHVRMADSCTAQFVVSRTRVAHLSEQFIPRLELLAALLLSRLLLSVTQGLVPEQALDKPQCYTESKIVLYWVRRVEREWKQFMQNRVNEIRALMPADYWYHYPGEQNPASGSTIRSVDFTQSSSMQRAMDDYSNMAVRPHIPTTEPGSSHHPRGMFARNESQGSLCTLNLLSSRYQPG